MVIIVVVYHTSHSGWYCSMHGCFLLSICRQQYACVSREITRFLHAKMSLCWQNMMSHIHDLVLSGKCMLLQCNSFYYVYGVLMVILNYQSISGFTIEGNYNTNFVNPPQTFSTRELHVFNNSSFFQIINKKLFD